MLAHVVTVLSYDGGTVLLGLEPHPRLRVTGPSTTGCVSADANVGNCVDYPGLQPQPRRRAAAPDFHGRPSPSRVSGLCLPGCVWGGLSAQEGRLVLIALPWGVGPRARLLDGGVSLGPRCTFSVRDCHASAAGDHSHQGLSPLVMRSQWSGGWGLGTGPSPLAFQTDRHTLGHTLRSGAEGRVQVASRGFLLLLLSTCSPDVSGRGAVVQVGRIRGSPLAGASRVPRGVGPVGGQRARPVLSRCTRGPAHPPRALADVQAASRCWWCLGVLSPVMFGVLVGGSGVALTLFPR